MKSTQFISRSKVSCSSRGAALSLISVACALFASIANATDLADIPLTGSMSQTAKPNIMFLMDTSGSMGWSHMPDILEGANAAGVKAIGYKSAQCNKLYFNPDTVYELPRNADGSERTAPSFTSAPYDIYNTASTTVVDLSVAFKAYDDNTLSNGDRLNPGQTTYNDKAQPAYYYVYSGTQSLVAGSAPCSNTEPDAFSGSAVGATTISVSGGGTWTKVLVTSSQRQNFANWYTFYRTRMNLVKSGASRAFNSLNENFRVGFITIQPRAAGDAMSVGINADKYLAIRDFDAAHRSDWFGKVFSQVPGGASPAREGLARVGRHYAGKQDGINTGMTGDPVQYSCQQNFTIMMTDGYWNAQTETPGSVGSFRGGAVQIDGKNLVGNTDGILTDDAGWTPRPIWEGFADGKSVKTDIWNTFSYVPCATGWFDRSTSQILKSTQQNLQSSQQTLENTSQLQQSTVQNLRSSVQNLRDTSQLRQSTSQRQKRTVQDLRNTSQNVKDTSQVLQSTTQNIQTIIQRLRSTTQDLQSTSQTVKNTTQTLQSTTQNLRSTAQNLQSTSQTVKNTAQVLLSTAQVRMSTAQNLRSTTQNLQTTTQPLKSTSQIRWYNPATELWTPVASCPVGGTCQTVTTSNVPVSSCTAASASAGNSYTTTTCADGGAANVPVASCTASAGSSGNNWVTTSCPAPVTTSNVPVQTCTAASASSGNSWTTTTCSTNNTGPTPVQTCTAASASSGNSWTTTSCTNNNTGPTAVSSCTASSASSGNSWTTTTCTNNNQSNVPTQTCTAAAASSGNSWTTTTCPAPIVTTNVPVQTCTAAAAASGNSWTTTTCSTNNTGPTPVQTCSASAASSGNSWTTTSCTTNNTASTAVQTCTAAAGTSGNNWVTTVCTPNNQTNVPTQTCTASAATSGNSWTATTCPAPIVTTNVPVQTCTAAAAASGNNWTTTTCSTNNTSNVPVASCTPSAETSGNSWTTTTCTTNTISPATVVQTCTAVAPVAGNNYQETVCSTNVTSSVPVQTCTPSGPNAGNNWTTVTCTTNNQTNIPVQTCTPSSATSGNNWTTTTCPAPIVTTNVPVQTCTAATAASGNNWTTTTCPGAIDSGWVPVDTCSTIAETAGNNWVATTCRNNNTGPTGVQTCTPQTKAAGNNWTTITCNTVTTTNTPVQTCTATAAASGNSWTETSCPPAIVTTDVPVATCSPQTAASGNSWVTVTCSQNTTSNVPVGSCTNTAAAAGNNYVATTCNTQTSAQTPVQNCTPFSANVGNSWTATICTSNNQTNVPVASCTAAPASAGNNWMTVTCPAPVITTDVPSASCVATAASSGNAWTTTTCRTDTSDPVLVSSCTVASPVAGNQFTTVTCSPRNDGQRAVYTAATTVTTTLTSGGVVIAGLTPTVETTVSGETDVFGVCYLAGTTAGAPPALPIPNPVHANEPSPAPWPHLGPVPPLGCSGWPCTVSESIVGGSLNSLADVAQYYYITDLRPDMDDNLEPAGLPPEGDHAKHQHMTTFAIALGASGTLSFNPAYRTAATGDFAEIRKADGTKQWPTWPDTTKATWDNTSKTYTNSANWEDPRSIDDFWHAAVNGRGQFFSAEKAQDMEDGLAKALNETKIKQGSGSTSANSSRTPVLGDSLGFFASHTSVKWTGEVLAREFDVDTGVYKSDTVWSAATKLVSQVGASCDNRKIYLMRPGTGASRTLVDFTSNTYACNSSMLPTGSPSTALNSTELAWFNSASNAGELAQFKATGGGTAAQLTAAKANLVNYLRGHSVNEGFKAGESGKLFRTREGRLGDIVNSSPVYVRTPFADYLDPGYSAFQADKSSRTPAVYVGANDGMLHAFKATKYVDPFAATPVLDADGGKEMWAVIPYAVGPDLYRLADVEYASKHRFFVDGSPLVADIDKNAPCYTLDGDCASPAKGDVTRASWTPAWRTILVSGLNKGGKSFFALDVTTPESPTALWEFTDSDMGYSYGQPVVTKLEDGRWVVLLTSGYGSSATQGYLYVLEAYTGTLLFKIATSGGDGLAQINAYINNALFDNTAMRVYGGDLDGNVWMFDINETYPVDASGREAYRLGTALTAGNEKQPITMRPELAEFGGKPWVYVGTGRLLGTSDLDQALPAATQTQSIYGFIDLVASPDKDDPADPSDPQTHPYAAIRDKLKPLSIAYDADRYRVVSTESCDTAATPKRCRGEYGWFVDLPDSGERMVTEMKVVGSTLAAASNVFQGSVCASENFGWLNMLNAATGTPLVPTGVPSPSVVASKRFAAPIAGISILNQRKYDATGRVIGVGSPRLVVTTSDATSPTTKATGAGKVPGTNTNCTANDPRCPSPAGVAEAPQVSPKPLGRRVSWQELIQE